MKWALDRRDRRVLGLCRDFQVENQLYFDRSALSANTRPWPDHPSVLSIVVRILSEKGFRVKSCKYSLFGVTVHYGPGHG